MKHIMNAVKASLLFFAPPSLTRDNYPKIAGYYSLVYYSTSTTRMWGG